MYVYVGFLWMSACVFPCACGCLGNRKKLCTVVKDSTGSTTHVHKKKKKGVEKKRHKEGEKEEGRADGLVATIQRSDRWKVLFEFGSELRAFDGGAFAFISSVVVVVLCAWVWEVNAVLSTRFDHATKCVQPARPEEEEEK